MKTIIWVLILIILAGLEARAGDYSTNSPAVHTNATVPLIAPATTNWPATNMPAVTNRPTTKQPAIPDPPTGLHIVETAT